jgi:catechol 2,3-dioxygenase-like lactoylglutathione lyase family enzyme
MRRLLPILLFACGLHAQLAPPNETGVSIGHLHLLVSDPEAQKKVWIEALGAQPTKTGTLEMLRLSGVFLIVGKARMEPTGGTDGSTVHHVGFEVKDMAAVKAKLDAAGISSAPVNGNPNQILAQFPDQVTVELTADPALTTPVAMHHIHLATADPEALRGWYVKTFGLKAGARGNFLAAFVPGGEIDTRKTAQAQTPTKGRTLDHIGFEVRGLEAFCKKLEAEGVKFESPVRDVPQIGLKIAFLIDPEGTRIELTEGLMGK